MRRLAAAVACLLLVSCSGRQIIPEDREAAELAFQQRISAMESMTSWDLSGKLSVDDGEDGGSGRLSWMVRDESSIMNFRGALGKGAWQLDQSPGFAQLSKADGSINRASSVNELLQKEVGWHIPVNALKWWALGVSAPGETQLQDIDGNGRLLALQQHGWNISFSRYRFFGNLELPARIDAVRGPYRVKMAVSNWTPFDETSDEQP
jgi:outer membrane lipoprotein LolB